MAAPLLLVPTALFGLGVGLFGNVLLQSKVIRYVLFVVGALLLHSICLPFWLHLGRLISLNEYWFCVSLYYTATFLLCKHLRPCCSYLFSFLFAFTSWNLLCLCFFRKALSSLSWDLQYLSVIFIFQRKPLLVASACGGSWIFVRCLCELLCWKSGGNLVVYFTLGFWLFQTFVVPVLPRGFSFSLCQKFVCVVVFLMTCAWIVLKLVLPPVFILYLSPSTGVDCLLLLYWVLQWAAIKREQFWAALRTAAFCFALAMIRYGAMMWTEWFTFLLVLVLYWIDFRVLGGVEEQWAVCKFIFRALSRRRDHLAVEERVAPPSQPPSPHLDRPIGKEDVQESKSNVDWVADLEDLDDDDDDGLCVVCLEHLSCVALAPCGHTVTCESCTESVLQRDPLCPLCRTPVTQTLRIYR